jgi:hypothetical protein
MLGLCPDSVVDWDDLLSETTLAGIVKLPQVPTGSLYSIDIIDMRELTGMCLLTG